MSSNVFNFESYGFFVRCFFDITEQLAIIPRFSVKRIAFMFANKCPRFHGKQANVAKIHPPTPYNNNNSNNVDRAMLKVTLSELMRWTRTTYKTVYRTGFKDCREKASERKKNYIRSSNIISFTYFSHYFDIRFFFRSCLPLVSYGTLICLMNLRFWVLKFTESEWESS